MLSASRSQTPQQLRANAPSASRSQTARRQAGIGGIAIIVSTSIIVHAIAVLLLELARAPRRLAVRVQALWRAVGRAESAAPRRGLRLARAGHGTEAQRARRLGGREQALRDRGPARGGEPPLPPALSRPADCESWHSWHS